MTRLFETDRLIVRHWTAADVDDAFVILGDPEVTRYLGEAGAAFPDLDRTSEWLQRVEAKSETWAPLGSWAAVEKATGNAIGGGGLLTLEDGPDVEIFYHFRQDRWGLGYATELARGLIVYGFAKTDLPRLVGVAYPNNIASHHVLTKAGMTHLGRRLAYGADLEYFVIARPS